MVCSLRCELKFHDESGTGGTGATHSGGGESRLQETLDHDAFAGRTAGRRSGGRVSEGDRLRGLDQRGPWDARPVRASDGATGGAGTGGATGRGAVEAASGGSTACGSGLKACIGSKHVRPAEERVGHAGCGRRQRPRSRATHRRRGSCQGRSHARQRGSGEVGPEIHFGNRAISRSARTVRWCRDGAQRSSGFACGAGHQRGGEFPPDGAGGKDQQAAARRSRSRKVFRGNDRGDEGGLQRPGVSESDLYGHGGAHRPFRRRENADDACGTGHPKRRRTLELGNVSRSAVAGAAV